MMDAIFGWFIFICVPFCVLGYLVDKFIDGNRW